MTKIKACTNVWATLLCVILLIAPFARAATTHPNSPLETEQGGLSNAVVLVYHHVSSKTPPSTSISPEKFAEHMAYLKANHTVLSLSEVVNATRNKRPLPENAVAITFDDGFANIYENGHPILKQYGFPYTIFINPSEIGIRANQLDWDTIRQMQSEGVSFANHTLDHIHLLNKLPDETHDDWLTRVWQNVSDAEQRILSKANESLRYLAYPYGEYNKAIALKVKDSGYIGFGQQSGAIGPYSDFSALPRFPAAGIYANLNTLKVKLNSLAMPVIHSSLDDPQLPSNTLTTPVTLTLSNNEDVRLNQAMCYFSGESITPQVSDNTLTFILSKSLPVGRSRVNCTAPSNTYSGRYYWYSQVFFVGDSQGYYPD